MTAALQPVILLAAGTRWDGEVTRVCVGSRTHLERTGPEPGQILCFEPTGAEVEVDEVYHVKGGERHRALRCAVYAVVGERRFEP